MSREKNILFCSKFARNSSNFSPPNNVIVRNRYLEWNTTSHLETVKNPRIAGKFRLHSRQTKNKAILHRLRGESERNQHRNLYHWLTADDKSYRGQAERATEAVRSSISSALSVALAESLSSLQRYIIRSPLNMVGFHCRPQSLSQKKWYFFATCKSQTVRDSKKRFKEETIPLKLPFLRTFPYEMYKKNRSK